MSFIIFQKSEEAKRGPTPEVIDRATTHVPKSKEKPLTANITVGLDVSILGVFFWLFFVCVFFVLCLCKKRILGL